MYTIVSVGNNDMGCNVPGAALGNDISELSIQIIEYRNTGSINRIENIFLYHDQELLITIIHTSLATEEI